MWEILQAVAKAARRGGERVAADDAHMDGMHDFFHLYDLVRVDVEAEAAKKAASQEQAKRWIFDSLQSIKISAEQWYQFTRVCWNH